MTARQLSELALGLLGISTLVRALDAFFGIALLYAQYSDAPSAIGLTALVPAILFLGLGYFLVFHNGAVARAIFPGFSDAPLGSAPDLERTVVCLVGVYLLGLAIPGLIRGLLNSALVNGLDSSARRVQFKEFIAYGLQTAFALVLLFRPERAIALWRGTPRLTSP